MIFTSHFSSPLGDVLLAERGGSLIGLWIKGQKAFLDSYDGKTAEKETAVLNNATEWLNRYFAGENPDINELKLAPEGSIFRKEVWKILIQIPYGKTITYGEIAKQVAPIVGKEKMSAQAVGNAVGHNPISIIIPCHRVIGSCGNLTGYAGGIDTKIWLLEHEGLDMSKLYAPIKAY